MRIRTPRICVVDCCFSFIFSAFCHCFCCCWTFFFFWLLGINDDAKSVRRFFTLDIFHMIRPAVFWNCLISLAFGMICRVFFQFSRALLKFVSVYFRYNSLFGFTDDNFSICCCFFGFVFIWSLYSRCLHPFYHFVLIWNCMYVFFFSLIRARLRNARKSAVDLNN